MESPRGINDPCLGAFAEILAQADCILLLGKRLDFTLAFGTAPAFDRRAARFCRSILKLPSSIAPGGRSRVASVASAVADVGAAIDTLTRCWRDNVDRSKADGWTKLARRSPIVPPRGIVRIPAIEGKLHPVEACRPLQSLLDSHPEFGPRLRRRRIRPMGAGVPARTASRDQWRRRIDRFRVAVRACRSPRPTRSASRRADG